MVTKTETQILQKISALDSAYKAPTKVINYGTAGFRSKADQLDRHCFRSGVFMGLKAIVEGLVGVQITASHNPKEDNGIKMQESTGGMLHHWWEKHTDALMNAPDFEEELQKFVEVLKVKFSKEDFFALQEDQQPLLVIGYDTRESSERLHNALIAGAEAVGVRSLDFGAVTTPQLCWLVSKIHENDGDFIRVDKNDYVDNYAGKFKAFLDLVGDKETEKYDRRLWLDCSNGIGGAVIKQFKEHLPLDLVLENTGEDVAYLNDGCGAEFVHKDQKVPANYHEFQDGKKCASFDGDADRLIYFYREESGRLVIIDGDKQFALIIDYIKSLLKELGVTQEQLSIVHVLTAYANSRTFEFLVRNEVYYELVATGVKHAHPVVERFDIGANDEPNGHGTVCAKMLKVREVLAPHQHTLQAKKIIALLELSNFTVGDAITGMLILEAIMRDRDMSIQDFAALYSENPSKMFKAVVEDRSRFKVIPDESRLTAPIELQEEIDRLCASVSQGRAFVRPSGTEDILRLYSEAETSEDMEKLAADILTVI